jgi:hypothetical protein
LKHSSSPKLIRYSLLLQHLDFDVVHIRGCTNIVPDFLSRYPITENEETKDSETPVSNSLLDVDHYNFLTAIDVDQVCQDSQIERRNEDKRRRRNFKIYELAPISAANTSNENQKDSSNQQRKGTRQRTNANKKKGHTTSEQTSSTTTAVSTDPDTQLMDAETSQMYDNLNQEVAPIINLTSQAENDPFIAAVIEYLQTETLTSDKELAKRVLFQIDDFFILNDQLFHLARMKNKKRLHLMTPRFQRLVIPRSFRIKLMTSIHEFSHFGFLKCYLTARQKFYWVGMASDFKAFTDSCLVCQQIKSTPQPKYPITSIPVTNLFETLTIDFHTVKQDKRYQKENIYRHVLVLVDQYSQYITLVPTKDQKAETAAKAIMDHIILRFGCFRYLISDRGTSWLNELFQCFLKMPNMKIFHYKTSPYHPATNSMSEIQNRHIVRVLRAYCTDKKQFHEFLPTIAIGVNASSNLPLGCSAHFLLYGQEYRWPIEIVMTTQEQSLRETTYPHGLQAIADRLQVLRDIVKQNINDAKSDMERVRNANTKPHDFEVGQRVFVSHLLESNKIRNKHNQLYCGPYIVLQLRENLAKLQHFYSGKILKNWVNVCHLKRLKDESRIKLYNKLSARTTDTETIAEQSQPTVQTVIEKQRQCFSNNSELATPYRQSRKAPLQEFDCILNARKTANTNEQSPVTYDQCCLHNEKKLAANTIDDQSWPSISTRTTDRLDKPDSSKSSYRSLHNHQGNSKRQYTGFGRLPTTHDLRSEFVTNSHDTMRNPQTVPTQSQYLRPLLSDASEQTCTSQQPIYQHTRNERMQGFAENQGCICKTDRQVNAHANTHEYTSDEKHLVAAARSAISDTPRCNECRQLQTVSSVSSEMRSAVVNVHDMQQGPADSPEVDLQMASTKQIRSPSVSCKNERCASSAKPQHQTTVTNDSDAASENRKQTESKPRSYYAMDMQMTGDPYDYRIVRVSQCKRLQSVTHYEVYLKGESKPRWVTIAKIPPNILTNFYINKLQKRKKKRLLC